MKLVPHELRGAGSPGLLDDDGNIRDVSDHIADISGYVLCSEVSEAVF